MSKNNITKVEHIWCKEDDRWLYIAYNDQSKIVGINFAQGDFYDCFTEKFCYTHKPLTRFYREMIKLFNVECVSTDKVEFINKCIWAWLGQYETWNNTNTITKR